jgi:hypothetical protein
VTFLKSALLLFALLVGTAEGVAQQITRMDLRADGDILAGERKDYFLQTELSKLSKNLRNELTTTKGIKAIVVPAGRLQTKEGSKYFLGIVKGEVLVPTDVEILESDFKVVRDYCKDKDLAAVESAVDDFRRAQVVASSEEVDRKLTKVLALTDSSTGNKATRLYAGYLLEELDASPSFQKFQDLVTLYRSDRLQKIKPLIVKAINSNGLSWSVPLVISDSYEVSKPTDFRSTSAGEAVSGEIGRDRILAFWSGRSLIVVREKPDQPFNIAEHKNLFGYLLSTKPDMVEAKTKTTVINDCCYF